LIKAAIFEYDISTALQYEVLLQRLGVKVLGVYKTWDTIITIILENPPDFMIVDLISGHNEDGLKLLLELKNLGIPAIVITDRSSVEIVNKAIDFNVSAFLNKPVSKASLEFALKKCIKSLNNNSESEDHILLKDKSRYIKAPLSQIIRVDIEGNYCSIRFNSGKRFIVKSSLLKFQEKLDNTKFFRCHRGTILNYQYVREFNMAKNMVILKNDEEVQVGIRYKSSIKQFFKILDNN